MGQTIIKIKDRYFIWSTISDAPISYGMTIDELKNEIKIEYGRNGLDELESRLIRVEKTGTSMHGSTLSDMILLNRAGENESELTEQEIYDRYCKDIGTNEKENKSTK